MLSLPAPPRPTQTRSPSTRSDFARIASTNIDRDPRHSRPRPHTTPPPPPSPSTTTSCNTTPTPTPTPPSPSAPTPTPLSPSTTTTSTTAPTPSDATTDQPTATANPAPPPPPPPPPPPRLARLPRLALLPRLRAHRHLTRHDRESLPIRPLADALITRRLSARPWAIRPRLRSVAPPRHTWHWTGRIRLAWLSNGSPITPLQHSAGVCRRRDDPRSTGTGRYGARGTDDPPASTANAL